MDGYQVQVDELGKLISELETAADRMTEANKKLAATRLFGELGNGMLGAAGGGFEEAWEYGIGKLGESAEDVTERLKSAKSRYQELEDKYGGMFTDTGEPGGMVGGGWTGPLQDKPWFPGGASSTGTRKPDADGGGYTGGIGGVLGGDR